MWSSTAARLGSSPSAGSCRWLRAATTPARPAHPRPGRAATPNGSHKLVGLWEDNYRVHWARQLCKAAHRAGLDVGGDQVAPLMRAAGIEGDCRTRPVRTSRPDPVAARHPDLV